MPAAHWLAIPADRHSRPGWEMRFHDDWWHAVFTDSKGRFDVVLLPTGILLARHPTLEAAMAGAEKNARERALNTLATAQVDIRRSAMVLGVLSAPTTHEPQAGAPAQGHQHG